jgi:translation elongation factor EF-G
LVIFQTLAPRAELTRDAVDLRALTGGRGSFTVAHDHHDAVPDHLAASIAQAASPSRSLAFASPNIVSEADKALMRLSRSTIGAAPRN